MTETACGNTCLVWMLQWGTNNIRLPDRWRHLGSGGWRVRELSVVCLHSNAIVARCILDIDIALWGTRTASAPSILLVLLEPHWLTLVNVKLTRPFCMYLSDPAHTLIQVFCYLWGYVDCLKVHSDWRRSQTTRFLLTIAPDSIRRNFNRVVWEQQLCLRALLIYTATRLKVTESYCLQCGCSNVKLFSRFWSLLVASCLFECTLNVWKICN